MLQNLLTYANLTDYSGNCPEHDEYCIKDHKQNCIRGHENSCTVRPEDYMPNDESCHSESTPTESVTSLDLLRRRTPRRSNSCVFQSPLKFYSAEDKCRRANGAASYNVGRRRSYVHLERPSRFNTQNRKQTATCFCAPKLKNKQPKKGCGNESAGDWGSSDNNKQENTVHNQVQIYPVCVYEPAEKETKKVEEPKQQNFPFKSTPSGNYKLSPRQVVYESKNLSIVAAQPEKVCLNVTDPSVSSKEDKQCANLCQKLQKDNYVTTCLYTAVDTQGKPAFNSDTTDSLSESDTGDNRIIAKTSEMSLSKMGYVTDNCVEWKNLKNSEMPKKSDLQKRIMSTVLNRVHPDVHVKIGDSTYKCHKIVLQCYCTYFNAEQEHVFEIPESEVPIEIFSLIYQWMLNLDRDSYRLLKRDQILSVLKAARFLDIKELDTQCWAYIDNTEIFYEDKAFLLYLAARQQGNKDIMELMVPRVQRFFLTLVSSKEYVELSLEEVCTFLRSNYICIHNEMEVFMSAVRWLDHDWQNRKQHTAEVMKCVRFGFINPQVLITIRRNPQSPEFQRVADMAGVSQMIDDGLALVIAKFYYDNESDEKFHKNIAALGLTIPAPRNWSGTDKNYHTYQEFLRDLYHYKSKQRIEKRHSKMKMEIEKVNKDDFLSSAVLPPASEQKIRASKYSSMLRCIPKMNSQEIDLLQKLVCKGEKVPKERSSDVKKHLITMAEEKHQESKGKETEPDEQLKKKPLKRKDTPASVETQQEAALKIQKAYRTYSRRRVSPPLPAARPTRLSTRGHISALTDMRSSAVQPTGRLESLTNPPRGVGQSKTSPPDNSNEKEEEAARVIQHAYRHHYAHSDKTQHSRGASLTTSERTGCSLPAILLRSATQPDSKCEDSSLPLDSYKDTVYILGGADPFDLDSQKSSQQIFQYVASSNSWKLSSYLPQPLFYHCALFYLGKLYIAGGKNPNKLMREQDAITSKVWRFDPEHKHWVSLRDMTHARRSFCLVGCNGRVYAIGGRDGKETVLDSVEMYNIETNEWVEVAPLKYARSAAGACELKGCIWVAGGILSLDNIATNTVECYNPIRDQWTKAGSLRFTFAYTQMLAVKGSLYLIGGTIGLEGQPVTGSGKQIDVWHPETERWSLSSTMSKPRHAHAAAFLRGKHQTGHVLIMGGMSTKHKSVMHNTECWNVEDDSWILGVAPIPHPVSGLAALSMPVDTFT